MKLFIARDYTVIRAVRFPCQSVPSGVQSLLPIQPHRPVGVAVHLIRDFLHLNSAIIQPNMGMYTLAPMSRSILIP